MLVQSLTAYALSASLQTSRRLASQECPGDGLKCDHMSKLHTRKDVAASWSFGSFGSDLSRPHLNISSDRKRLLKPAAELACLPVIDKFKAFVRHAQANRDIVKSQGCPYAFHVCRDSEC